MVHKVPSPCDSTSRAMMASTSGKGAPARINCSISSTDSEESKLDVLRSGEDCITDSIVSLSTPLMGSPDGSVEFNRDACQQAETVLPIECTVPLDTAN